jgi:hypothetical protein
MKWHTLRRLIIVALVAFLILVVGAAVWIGAVENWIGHQLLNLAAAHLVPSFDFDDLSYTFPTSITLRGVRLTSPDPEAPDQTIEILTVDSLDLVLTEIPRPDETFHMEQIALARPTLHLVRIPGEKPPGKLLGFSGLFVEDAARAARPKVKLSDVFQVRVVSIDAGRVRADPRDGTATIMLIDGISSQLLLHPDDAGSYGLDFALDHHPVLAMRSQGRLLADDHQLEIDSLSATLDLAREHDHYLTPPVQTVVAANDITGRLSVAASGTIPLDDVATRHYKARIELQDTSFTAGDYVLALDRVDCRISAAESAMTIEEFKVDTLGGHIEIGGEFEFGDSTTGSLSFDGADLQIANLLRDSTGPGGLPEFSGLLDFSGTLAGPLADLDRHARGSGRLSLRKARLARLPTLSEIDEALDQAAEDAMKKERKGHDELSLEFSFAGDRAKLEKLRMNSLWYGLRGHGDVGFDSRLDMAVTGGPLQRIENELGALGDVLGEISETIVRARVSGTLSEPKVGIEVLRQRHH